MKVVFFHIGMDEYPRLMVESARQFTDDIVQLTDTTTPAISGCETYRFKGNAKELMVFRMEAYASYNQPGLYVDSDVLFRKNPAEVWDRSFDVALTRRQLTIHTETGQNIAEAMPYNAGVIFCRSPLFFSSVLHVLKELPQTMKEWWGDQVAIAAVAPQFNVLELSTTQYNCTFKEHKDMGDPYIVHFKGERKKFMQGGAK